MSFQAIRRRPTCFSTGALAGVGGAGYLIVAEAEAQQAILAFVAGQGVH